MKTLYRIERVQGRMIPEIIRGGYKSKAEAKAIAAEHSGYDSTTDTLTEYCVTAYLDGDAEPTRRSSDCPRCGGPSATGGPCGEC